MKFSSVYFTSMNVAQMVPTRIFYLILRVKYLVTVIHSMAFIEGMISSEVGYLLEKNEREEAMDKG